MVYRHCEYFGAIVKADAVLCGSCLDGTNCTTENRPTVVGRAINGISLNGDEWLLDDNQSPLVFKNKLDAVNFLRNNGFKNNKILNFSFIDANN